jgi:hypothetical protein
VIEGSGVRFPAPAICESLGQALLSHIASGHPAVMGTWWNNRTKIVRLVISAAMCACILPGKMRLCQCDFQYQGR